MTISGQYATAEIFTDNIEDAALQWVMDQCGHPAFEGVRILQMPDVHAGNSCNVGTVYKIGSYVNPDHVGGGYRLYDFHASAFGDCGSGRFPSS